MFPPRVFFSLVVKQGVRGSEASKISAMLFLLMPNKRLQWRHYHIFRPPVCYWPLDLCPLTVRNKVLECKYTCFSGHVLGEGACVLVASSLLSSHEFLSENMKLHNFLEVLLCHLEWPYNWLTLRESNHLCKKNPKRWRITQLFAQLRSAILETQQKLL